MRKTGALLLTGALTGTLALAVGAAPATAGHPAQRSLTTLNEVMPSPFKARVAANPPLTGTGENMALVANVPLSPDAKVKGGANDEDFSSNNGADIELAGDHAYVGAYSQGMVVVNISSCDDPKRFSRCKPFVQGAYKCSGGQFDVQLSPDARVAVVAHEEDSADKACHPGEEGAAIVDVSDKSRPREVAFISDRKPGGSSTGQVVDGAHNVTLDWPNLYIDQYTQDYPKAEIYSLAPQASAPNASPSNPVKIGEVPFSPTVGNSGFHDSFPSHRPDGKDLLYGASIQRSDIVDIGNPAKPRVVQSIFDPQVGISHGAEPNHDRSLLIVTDEYGGGSGVGACGGVPGDAVPELPIPGQAGSAGVGAVHFYRLDKAGRVGAAGTDKAGIFNIPPAANEPAQIAAEAGCTSHVFWQAPRSNRMTIAWYGRGSRVVNFANPARPRQIGWFVPTGADTWSSKPHRGFIFTGDAARGMDVLRYTGEGGKAWPATSGPAELQRGYIQRSGPGTGKAGVPARKRLRIGRRNRRLRRGRVPVVARCLQATTCRGRLGVRALVRSRLGRRVLRNPTIGRRRFVIRAGRRKTLLVRLNRRGRRVMRNRRRVRIVVTARLRPQAHTSARTATVRARYRLLRVRRGR